MFLFSYGLSLELVPLQYIHAAVFAVEEINNSTMLLPGVKLGYHIFDSCGRPPWALQAALSLVGGDSTSCNSGSLLCICIILCPLPNEIMTVKQMQSCV